MLFSSSKSLTSISRPTLGWRSSGSAKLVWYTFHKDRWYCMEETVGREVAVEELLRERACRPAPDAAPRHNAFGVPRRDWRHVNAGQEGPPDENFEKGLVTIINDWARTDSSYVSGLLIPEASQESTLLAVAIPAGGRLMFQQFPVTATDGVRYRELSNQLGRPLGSPKELLQELGQRLGVPVQVTLPVSLDF